MAGARKRRVSLHGPRPRVRPVGSMVWYTDTFFEGVASWVTPDSSRHSHDSGRHGCGPVVILRETAMDP